MDMNMELGSTWEYFFSGAMFALPACRKHVGKKRAQWLNPVEICSSVDFLDLWVALLSRGVWIVMIVMIVKK